MKRTRLPKGKKGTNRLRVIPMAKDLKGKNIYVGDVGECSVTNSKKDLQFIYVLEEDGSKNWYHESGVQRSDYPLKYAYGKIVGDKNA